MRKRAPAAEKGRTDELIDGDLNRWSETGAAVKRQSDRHERASRTLHGYRQLRDETDEWLDGALLSVETADDVSDKTRSAAAQQQRNVAGLRDMIADAAEAVGLDAGDAPLDEIERMSAKLERVQRVLAALGDVAAKKDKLSADAENAKRLLHDTEKVRSPKARGGVGGINPPPDKLKPLR